MINKYRWLNSLPLKKNNLYEQNYQIEESRWINSIPKKNYINPYKKYISLMVFFISGFLLVSALKNETRNLQKDINDLEDSIKIVKLNLDQAILDNEVLTSPENISILAKEYLDIHFKPYKTSQIIDLNKQSKNLLSNKKEKKLKYKDLSTNIKLKVKKKIKEKKNEIKKLKVLYQEPENIPSALRTHVSKKVDKKKSQIKEIYTSPKESVTLDKIRNWAAVQMVKVLLGVPVLPGN